ncbi:MAG TPA: preprotein translocase subunit SecE [Blastocatellia bacterium]|nr:preprotein translocase subunit SecE [Blastocatellia bacterium]
MSRVTELSEDEEPAERDAAEDTEAEESAERGGIETPVERPGVRLPQLPLIPRIREFYHSIKLEMARTTWPTRTEVWSTTLVVLIAVVFFGFYLWGVDRLVTVGFEYLEKSIK